MQTQIEKLDNMLTYFSKVDKAVNMATLNTIFGDCLDTKMTLRKLRNNGHVEGAFISKEQSPNTFVISFDGLLFYQQGGYTAKAQKEAKDALLVEMEIKRRRDMDDLLIKNSTHLNTLTARMLTWNRLAVLIGILVLLYYILSWFCPHYSDCFCEMIK